MAEPTEQNIKHALSLIAEHYDPSSERAQELARDIATVLGDSMTFENHVACCDEAARQQYLQGQRDMLARCIREARREQQRVQWRGLGLAAGTFAGLSQLFVERLRPRESSDE